jgi:predicted RecA/RadA family phage recombinase
MKTFIQSGDCITVIAPAGGTVSGELYKVGAFIGVAATTEVAGASVVLKLCGVFGLTKISAQAWAQGVATEIAANPSATGACRLNGVSAPAPV